MVAQHGQKKIISYVGTRCPAVPSVFLKTPMITEYFKLLPISISVPEIWVQCVNKANLMSAKIHTT